MAKVPNDFLYILDRTDNVDACRHGLPYIGVRQLEAADYPIAGLPLVDDIMNQRLRPLPAAHNKHVPEIEPAAAIPS
ncbi:MAG: hypothetical protein U1C55_10150 [Smithellaceae bacterium]|nr:hypothetical protein [Smithellaceae bacterium]